MKGLELSELFYREQVQPVLEQKFAAVVPRIAVGLGGRGLSVFWL